MKIWNIEKAVRKSEISDIVASIVNIRGYRKEEIEIDKDRIYNLMNIRSTLEATNILLKHIKQRSKIFIHGDYDADGACATAILWRFIKEFVQNSFVGNIDIFPIIPSRVEDGYGVSDNTLQKIIEQGGNLVISVDCGIRDATIIHKYSDKLDFIITDHHTPPDGVFDEDYTIVHQMNKFDEHNLSGSAVVLGLILRIADVLKFDKSEILDKYLPFVAISTITDIIKLTGISRSIVRYGLDLLNTRRDKYIGLSSLIDESGYKGKDIDTNSVGFTIGPRLNATGRIGDPMDAVRLLCTESVNYAKNLAQKLKVLNTERQKLTEDILREAVEGGDINVESNDIITVWGDKWDEGVIGLVAGKLVEKFDRPVLVSTVGEKDIRGSARSVNGIDITSLIVECSAYLNKYGGHSMAAGFSVREAQLIPFYEQIKTIYRNKYVNYRKPTEITIDIILDSPINLSDVEMIEKKLKPFGFGFPNIKYLIADVELISKDTVGKENSFIKYKFYSSSIGDSIDIVDFDRILVSLELGEKIEMVCNISINVWNGMSGLRYRLVDWVRREQ